MIIGPDHVVVFDAIEFVFYLSYRGAVSVHILIGAIPILVELIDHKGRVAVHLEAFNAKLNSYTETIKCRLILSGIIGCSEV